MTDGIQHIGKLLLMIGVAIALIGTLLLLSAKIPWLGKLPGDFLIQKKNYTFYFPLATSLVVSILLTLLFWFFARR